MFRKVICLSRILFVLSLVVAVNVSFLMASMVSPMSSIITEDTKFTIGQDVVLAFDFDSNHAHSYVTIIAPSGVKVVDRQDYGPTSTTEEFILTWASEDSAERGDYWVEIDVNELGDAVFPLTNGIFTLDREPVVFLHGLTGSPLKDKASGNTLWPKPLGQGGLWGDVSLLACDELGEPLHDIEVGSCLDLPMGAFYSAMASKLAADFPLYYVSYDWRFSPDELIHGDDDYVMLEKVTSLMYGVAHTPVYFGNLQGAIDFVKTEHHSSQANLVAHSMGGIIAANYVNEFSEDINKYITIGTPYAGTPRVTHVIGTGMTETIFVNMFTDYVLRTLSPNFKCGPFMVPNTTYFSYAPYLSLAEYGLQTIETVTNVSDDISISPDISEKWVRVSDIRKLNTYSETINHLRGRFNAYLFDLYDDYRVNFDLLDVLHSVDPYIIIGTSTATMSEIEDQQRVHGGSQYYAMVPLAHSNGDGTVVYESATWNKSLNTNLPFGRVIEISDVAHQNLPNNIQVLEHTRAILLDQYVPEVVIAPFSQNYETAEEYPTLYVEGVADLHVYGSNGSHLGRINGDEYEADDDLGVFYGYKINESDYVQIASFLDEKASRITINARDTGLFTLRVSSSERVDEFGWFYATENSQAEVVFDGLQVIFRFDFDGDDEYDEYAAISSEDLTQNPEPSPANLTHSVHPTSGGSISGMPTGFVEGGTPITLIPEANIGYVFDHWVVEGADGGSQTQMTAAFIMPANNVHVQAHFRVNQHSFSFGVFPSGGGSITGVPGSPVNEGTQVYLTAVPSAGYVFDHWVVEGVDGGNQTQMSVFFAMPMNGVSIQAHFSLDSSGNNNSGGDITTPEPAKPTCVVEVTSGGNVHGLPVSVDTGSYVYLVAVADYGYVFDRWEIVGVEASYPQISHAQFIMPAGAVYVKAHFRSTTFSITSDIGSGMGFIYGIYADTMVAGSYLYLTTVAENGYSFDHWTISGVDYNEPTVSHAQFIMPENDVHVIAHFILH